MLLSARSWTYLSGHTAGAACCQGALWRLTACVISGFASAYQVMRYLNTGAAIAAVLTAVMAAEHAHQPYVTCPFPCHVRKYVSNASVCGLVTVSVGICTSPCQHK